VSSVPAVGDSSAPTNDPKKPETDPKPDNKWVPFPSGKVSGEIVKLDENKKTVTIKVTTILGNNAKKYTEVDYAFLGDPQGKVRVPNPPLAFEDSGAIKKLTIDEIKKLKGDPSLPGFPGGFSDLKTGQMVQITPLRNKDAKPGDPDLKGDKAPYISMVVVVAEAPR